MSEIMMKVYYGMCVDMPHNIKEVVENAKE